MLSKTSTGASIARLLVIGAILVAICGGLACAAGRITDVTVAGKADRVTISVQGDCALRLMPIVSTQGKYLGFQFPCSLATKGRLVPIRSGGIHNVRYSSFRDRPPVARIVVNTNAHLDYFTQWSPDRTRVEITVLKLGQSLSRIARDSKTQAPAAQPSQPVLAEREDVVESAEPPAQSAQAAETPAAPRTPRVIDRSAYSSIAERSRLPRTPAPAPAAGVVKAPEPKPERAVAKQAPKIDRSRYAAIAAKSRVRPAAAPVPATVVETAKALEPKPKPAVVKQTPKIDPTRYAAIAAKSRARTSPAVVAAAPAPEPKVRVMGLVETNQQASAPAEPVQMAAGEPQYHVIAEPGRPMRMAVTVPVEAPQPENNRVSLNFLGADINDVLKAISVQSGRNIVASKDVKGEVTLSLSNVTVDDALDYVAKLSGYTYTQANGTYLVSSKDSIAKLASGTEQGFVTESMKLSYVQADDVIAFAKFQFPDVQFNKIGVAITGRVGLESKGGKTGIGLKNSLLVLTGPADQVAAAKELVQGFEDTFKLQTVERTRQIYRIRYVDASELADTLAQLIPGIGIAFAPSEGFKMQGPKSISVDDSGSSVEQDSSNKQMKSESSNQRAQDQTGAFATTGSEAGISSTVFKEEVASRPTALIIVGREAEVKRAIELATELDVKSPQIRIDAKITSITASGEKKLGVEWEWNDFAVMEGFTNFEKTVKSYADDTNSQNVQKSHSKWYRQPWNISAVLEALVTAGDAQVLASPNLLCLEGKPSVFFVGDEVTYIQRIETTPTGQNIVTDTKQVGVQLRAIGSASADGYITLNLHPEVSTIKLSVDQGVTLPVVSRRFTDHVVRVKEGQTIAIGGLIRNDDIDQMSKVPFLGDLPVLGHLFRHKSKTKDHTEVVMFITASVLKD